MITVRFDKEWLIYIVGMETLYGSPTLSSVARMILDRIGPDQGDSATAFILYLKMFIPSISDDAIQYTPLNQRTEMNENVKY